MAKMDLSRLSPWSIAASAGGLMLGIYAGLYLLLLAAGAGIAWFILHNMAPTSKRPVAPLVAWQFGQMGAFMIATIAAPGAWMATVPDVLVLGVLLTWLYLSQSRAAAWGLVAYQGVSALVNAWAFLHQPIESDNAKALVTHITWRVVAIVLLILFIRRPASVDTQAAAKTFE